MRLSATSTSVSSKTVAAAGGGGGGGVSLPDYLTNTDDLIYYIDFHNTDSYSGSGTSITDLSGSAFTTTIEGTEDTHWSYISSDNESSNPAWERTDGQAAGYIIAKDSSSKDFGFETGDFSIEMWFRPHSKNYFMTFINGSKDTDGNNISGNDPMAKYRIGFTGRTISHSDKGKLYLTVQDYNADGSAGPNGTVSSYANATWPGYVSGSDAWGDWTYVVFVRDGTSHKLYQNNTEVISLTSTQAYDFDNSNDYAIQLLDDNGQSADASTRFSAFRVYKGTALSSSDMTAHWNGEKADYGY